MIKMNKKIAGVLLASTILNINNIGLASNEMSNSQKLETSIDNVLLPSQADPKQPVQLQSEEVAQLVLLGRYGNGSVRKTRLIKEGYNYMEIQNIVNSMSKGNYQSLNEKTITSDDTNNELLSNDEIANLVMMGRYGNGSARKFKLESEGYNPSEIQVIINQKIANKSNADLSSLSNTKTVNESKSTKTKSMEAKSTITMNASAYSLNEKGMGNITANGTNLKTNPRVVAVDPSVIPLGTTVEIEGYGKYVAADTGGAIKGNKIDIHFQTVKECIEFERKPVKVTILN